MSSARLRFPAAHPAFAGHFPGAPLVPGALLLAAALEELGLACAGLEIASAKFLLALAPDTDIEVQCVRDAGGAAHLELRASGRLAATAMLREARA